MTASSKIPAALRRRTPVPATAAEVADYLEFAREVAARAGEAIVAHFRAIADVEDKAAGGGYDPVTVADREAEDIIRAAIRRRFPDHGIYGEERGFEPGRVGLTWVLDPIDGTRSFITGQLHWGTLVALFDGVRPIVGVMHQPYVGESFCGSAAGAELTTPRASQRLTVRSCKSLADATLCATHPEIFATAPERRAFDALAARTRLHRFGGDCYNYALVALGQVDIVLEAGLMPYDIQALIPIVEGAGGIVTDWQGAPATMGGQVLACGDPSLHAAALALLAGTAAA